MSGVATRWGVSTVVCRDRRQINRESKTRAVFPTTEIVADSPRVVARSKYPRHENRTVCRKGQCVLFIRLILFRAISQVISNETCRKHPSQQTGVSDQMIDDIGMICIRLLTRNIHIYIYMLEEILREHFLILHYYRIGWSMFFPRPPRNQENFPLAINKRTINGCVVITCAMNNEGDGNRQIFFFVLNVGTRIVR